MAQYTYTSSNDIGKSYGTATLNSRNSSFSVVMGKRTTAEGPDTGAERYWLQLDGVNVCGDLNSTGNTGVRIGKDTADLIRINYNSDANGTKPNISSKNENFNVSSLYPFGYTKIGTKTSGLDYHYVDSTLTHGVGTTNLLGVKDQWVLEIKTRNHLHLLGSAVQLADSDSNSLIVNVNTETFSPTAYPSSTSFPNIEDTFGKTIALSTSGNKSYYVIPWDTSKSYNYRLQSQVSSSTSKINNESDRIKRTVVADLFPDVLTVKMNQLSAPSNLRRTGNKLQWDAVVEGAVYTLYRADNSGGTLTKIEGGIEGTSYELDSSLYEDRIYTYYIKTNSRQYFTKSFNTYTATSADGSTKTINGHATVDINYYRESDPVTSDAWTNVGVFSAPTTSLTRLALNTYRYTPTSYATTNSTSDGAKIYYKYKNGTATNWSTEYALPASGYLELPDLTCGTTYRYKFYVKSTYGTSESNRKELETEFKPVKANSIRIDSLEKIGYNSYKVSYSTNKVSPANYSNISSFIDNATLYDRIKVTASGGFVEDPSTSPVTINTLQCNTSNIIKIETIFEVDNSYNNSYTRTLDSSYTPPLITPTLTKINNYDSSVDVYYGDVDDEQIKKEKILTSITLKWNAIEYASGYVIEDNYRVFDNDTQTYITGTKYYPDQKHDYTDYLTATTQTIEMTDTRGYHDYTVKAIASVDESYNSGKSNTIETTQNFPLNCPEAIWDSKTTTVKIKPVPDADFYSIQLVPEFGTTNVLWRSFKITGNELSYNYYNMVKDLDASENYIATIIARSYNAFYFHPSPDSSKNTDNEVEGGINWTPSHGTVKVIKLDTPRNLSIDDANVFRWDGDYTPESKTYRYEPGVKAVDGEWVYELTDKEQYSFPLGGSLYTFEVTARRNNSLTNHQPVYLDSDTSEQISKGTLLRPNNFKRYLNKLTWDDAGDNVKEYVIYDCFNKPGESDNTEFKSIVTISGGGTSHTMGLEKGDKYRPEEGKHVYQVQAIALINGVQYSSQIFNHTPTMGEYDDDEYMDYYRLHTIEADVKYLSQLAPYYPNDYESIINWDILDPNVKYETKVNGETYDDIQEENEYYYDEEAFLEPGTYGFTVRSRSTVDEFLFQRSDWSEPLYHNVIQLPRPEVTKTVDEDDLVKKIYRFSWPKIDNATHYKVYHTYVPNNDDIDPVDEIRQTTDNFYEVYLSGQPGAHTFFVTAISINSALPIPTDYPNPRYTESIPSEIFNFGVLAAPVISITNNVISWEPITGADYYKVVNYNEIYSQTDNTSFAIDLNKEYNYSIRVMACSLDDDTDDSTTSNSIEFTVQKLPSPGNLIINGNLMSWTKSISPVSDTTRYNIYAENRLIAISNTNSYDLSKFIANNAGMITFYVTAAPFPQVYPITNTQTGKTSYFYGLESNSSNTVLKSITRPKSYNVVIDDITYDDIQLPFTVHETLDETLDNAQITIAYIDRKEPFERLTPATVLIYEMGETSKKWPMIIESDIVEDVQIGTEIKYKHSLTLIERTLKIQTEPVPDFTVSRSKLKEILRLDERVKITPDFGGNRIPSANFESEFDNIAHIQWDDDGIFKKKQIDFFGISDKLYGNIYKEYYPGQSIAIPYSPYRLTSLCWDAEEQTKTVLEEIWQFIKGVALVIGGVVVEIAAAALDVTGIGAVLGVALAGVGGGLIGSGAGLIGSEIIMLVENEGRKAEYKIEGTLMDSRWPYPAYECYVRPHKNYYEKSDDETLIGKTDFSLTAPGAITYTWPSAGNYDIILEIPAVNYQNLADKGLINVGNLFTGTTIPWPTSINLMKDANGNSIKYRVVWPNITVKSGIPEQRVEGTTVAWVLDKIITMVNENKTGDEKYTLDARIRQFTSGLECPDLTFSGGKNLYEVLEEIGREFNGLPRLLDNNIITYDILDETTEASNLPTYWRDVNLLEIRKQDIELASSAFVSQVSNMIPEEDYTIHPSYNMWSYGRGDGNAAVVDVNTLAIAVDKPIYQIESVKVKNAIIVEGQVSTLEADITEYVYENTVYNALNPNYDGKGKALTWKQGDKFIRGLGQLPEQTALYTKLGWSSDKYVIQNIIEDYIDKVFGRDENTMERYKPNSPNKMLFQVKYRGYIDTTTFIENPDSNIDKYKMYTVLNQDTNTVSDKRFGDAALTQLKRHGGNKIEKSYLFSQMIFRPTLGNYAKTGNSVYYIDEITYEFTNNIIRADCNFSKNYSKINPRVALSTEYRQYELQAENNVNRMINFNQYCFLGKKDDNNQNKDFTQWENTLNKAFNQNTAYRPDTFYFNCYSNSSEKRLDYLTTKDDSEGSNSLEYRNVEGIALPCNYTRIGTSIQLSAQMADSFSAGQSVRKASTSEKDLGLLQSWVRYVSDLYKYQDKENCTGAKVIDKDIENGGQVPYMRITIGSLPDSIKTTDEFQMSYPSIKWFDQPTVAITDPFFSKMITPYKDQRERLGFNYQMHFMSNNPEVFIHKGFTKYLLRGRDDGKKTARPQLVAYNGNIGHKTHLQNFKGSSYVVFDKANKLIDCSGYSIADRDYDGMAVIWPDTQEIMLEIRRPVKKGERITYDNIYYNFSNKILK